jgi:Domain of unknown function (DUF4443)
LTGLLRLADRRSPGPSPSFEEAHLLLAFLTIGESGAIGRLALASRSGLGEGAVRTVLKKLREEGFVDSNASGSHLTAGGKRVYLSTLKRLSPMIEVEGSPLTMGRVQVSLAVRDGGRAVRSGIEQRDSAIRVGASGATTYLLKAGKFTVPGGSSDCEKDFPSRTWSVLRRGLRPRDGDSVILCGSESRTSAKLGALAAALTLL